MLTTRTRHFCLLLCCLTACVHVYAQSGSADALVGPASANAADRVNDPGGYFHLQARLGQPKAYQSAFPIEYPTNLYGIDPAIDPAVLNPLAGVDVQQKGSWRVIGNTGSKGAHAILFANDLVLFMERPNWGIRPQPNSYLVVDNGETSECAAMYNLTSNTFVPYHVAELPICGGHTLLPDGRAFIVGGQDLNSYRGLINPGMDALRLIDPVTQVYTYIGQMPRARWYATPTVLPDGNVLIVGGYQQEAGGWGLPPPDCSPSKGASFSDRAYDNPTFSIFNPNTFEQTPDLTLTILLAAWPLSSFPFVFQLPVGSVLVIAGTYMQALYFTPDEALADNATNPLPQLPVITGYPQTSAIAALPLEPPLYRTQVVIAGGSAQYCAQYDTPASNQSFLVDVTPGANHAPIQEAMNFPRVMGDLVNLPDGRLFLCNGAQEGIAGGGGPGAFANNGATVAEMYDPSKPIGSRWTTLADSQIWRMYHSTALLTRTGEVLVAGSEVTSEYRAQLYTPDYLHTQKPRPVITTVAADVPYASNFTISFSNVTTVDRVVLNRLASSTHGQRFDQRQVVLECNPGTGSGSTNCATPPNSTIAPPGQYMLFILSEGIPSVAEYVTLKLPSMARAAAPTPGEMAAAVASSG